MGSAQRGVAFGMAFAFFTALAVFTLAAILGEMRIAPNASVDFRLKLLAASLLVPAASLFFCIARLAKHRFATPDDINGNAHTEGTPRARLLQALLQNTLEQMALALPVYLSCSFLFPSNFLGLIPAAAAMFFVGRVLFFFGYSSGAPSRAFGFAFTFYPTVLLGCATVYFLATSSAA